MTVQELLRSKGTWVETVSPDITVGECARMLMQKGIGSIVVRDGPRNVIGLVSERDIVLGMTVHGARLHDMPIVALIQREVISCGPEDDLRQVMAIMTHRRVRHVPVVVGQRLRGLISIGDVVKERLGEVELEVNVLRDYARIHSSVP